MTNLSESDVSNMRRARNERGLTYKALGLMFNVVPGTAFNICNGRTWK